MTNALIKTNALMSRAPLLSQSEITLAVPVGSFETYVQVVNNFNILTREEEVALATQFREQDDLGAAERLIMSHLRYVVYVARGYSGYGLAMNDLVQEGNIGLMKSVKRFDPTMGVRLVSFAVHWIRAEIHEFILRNWRIVKIATTKSQRKLFFNLRSRKKHMGWFSAEEVNQVAKDLGVKPETVLEMESRLSGSDISFDPPSTEDSDDFMAITSPSGYLQDHRYDPAVTLEKTDSDAFDTSKLKDALSGLDVRSRDILTQRWLGTSKATLQDLATKYEVSAERIRQLEANALKKLRGVLEA